MLSDQTSVRKHYERHAFLRDQDNLEIISKYILGIECYNFHLPLNSSLLNTWQNIEPLVMAGLYVPDDETLNSMSKPVLSEGVDALEQLEQREKERESFEEK